MFTKEFILAKQKVKKIAKQMIFCVFILSIYTHIHDPVLQIFDWIVNIIHISFPFSINCFFQQYLFYKCINKEEKLQMEISF
jgi:hypothetical protein